jgi:SAM-dependent methyltransferase
MLIGRGWSARAAMHRALAPPGTTDIPSPTLLDRLLIERLGRMLEPRVLDAGCGFGGTIMRCAASWGGRYDGLTLSEVQRSRAQDAADRRGLGASCRFHRRSYDDPPAGPFDLIIAIESLVHSADIAHSIACLAGVLAPGGRLAIIDDMPDPSLADDDPDLVSFRDGWMLGRLPSMAQWQAMLARAGLTLVDQLDLTPWLRPRSLGRIGMLSTLNRAARVVVRWPGLGDVLDSHQGGLAVERLQRRGLMDYRLLIAQRQ